MSCPIYPLTEELPPEIVAEVATILAKGYLKCRQTGALPVISDPDSELRKSLLHQPNPSVYRRAVNASEKGEG